MGCITRRGPRDAIDRTAFTTAIYEFATHTDCNPGIASIVNGVGDSSEENGANDKSFAPRT